MTFVIRAATVADADELADLHVSTWREAYGELLPEGFFSPEYIDGRHRMWADTVTRPRPDVTLRVADSDGEIIGFAQAGPAGRGDDVDPPRGRQLYSIYVAAAHHGTGAAQHLLDEVLGREPALLWVAKGNARAIAFYVRNAFRADGAEQTYPGVPSLTAIRMIR